MKKKSWFIVIIVVVIVSIILVPAIRRNDDNNVEESGVRYKKIRVNKVGEEEITGYKAMGCDADIEILKIASRIKGLPVLSLDDSGFKYNTKLKEVVLPNTITVYLNSAPFEGCTNIEKLTLATDDVENLFVEYGSGNHNNTEPLPKSLKVIYLTDGCEYISTRSFRYCKYLEELHIPLSVKKIEDGTNLVHIGVNGNTPNAGKFTELPFLGCENLTIYCESPAKPSGWEKYWNNIDSDNKTPVFWGEYMGKSSLDDKREGTLIAKLDASALTNNPDLLSCDFNITSTDKVQIKVDSGMILFHWSLTDYDFSHRCSYRLVFKGLSFSGKHEQYQLSFKLQWYDSAHYLRYYNTYHKSFRSMGDYEDMHIYFNQICYDEFGLIFMFNHSEVDNATFKDLYFDFNGIEENGTIEFDSIEIYQVGSW